ncbi:3'5'-cyclic nucleotide phosphodiesterase family protein [Trichomonas vaginalis G3]|uniref:3'5'-cyclic nucleotide phosphodiesterase family protein n=1 Tax=Trichomonas vaginalis (strain ATCC PRA-98 / G3) TaxID=412133 RepID=A2FKH2_TRIV3|nr:cyclic nucleotide phosphodiesterase family [Trichomonas vaginalis G3]EAX94584.1 3'5'-cyclic nucleotide phosphodiesterase family protein [Trichomonas vaginalis G3]KAI5542784.1 cyclic nucleotide phosphodiesterase family [Trichomonas vaginalis G3]|eukprot:XP_001307514.1 3'5'-cyclic nucleotide phosphodiesterase family protein [Trichomonas vaginalis G3]
MTFRGVGALKPLGAKMKSVETSSKGTSPQELSPAPQKQVSCEENFDQMMIDIQTMPVNQVIESALAKIMNVSNVVLWLVYENEKRFYSPTLSKSIPFEKSLVGYCYQMHLIQVTENQSSHSAYDEEFDSVGIPATNPVIIFPVTNRADKIIAIIELSRKEPIFTEQEQQIVSYYQSKFRIYSRYLFEKMPSLSTAKDLVGIDYLSKVVTKLESALCHFFNANYADFYLMKTKDKVFLHFEKNNDNPTIINEENLGVIGYALTENYIVNEPQLKAHKRYNENVDNYGDQSALIVPYVQEDGKVWGIALHGRVKTNGYTKLDENLLLSLAPFAVKSLSTSLHPPPDLPQLDDFEKRLAALLEIAQALSGVLDIETLIPTIMERACNLLHAERCSLFLVDKGKQSLVTHFQSGLDKALTIPLTRGIVGHTAITGNVVNIKDAYSDTRFDRTIDQTTGFRTVSLLTVPIYNNRGEITGVTEMINKLDGEGFTEDDVRMMHPFNVFCGTSLDNAKLYKASIDLTKQLRTLTKMSAVLGQGTQLTGVVEEILENARSIVSASRATLFIYDSNERITKQFANIGNEIKYGTMFADIVVNERETKIFSSMDIARLTSKNVLESAIEKLMSEPPPAEIFSSSNLSTRSSKSNLSFLSSSSDNNNSVAQQQNVNESICSIPLMDSSGIILGVMELECNWKIINEDMDILDCFAVFASVAIERANLKDIAEHGQVEIDLKHWLTESERDGYSVPQSFQLPQEVIDGFFTVNFDAPMWDGIGHFKVIFNIFHHFGVLQIFKVTNEKFFRFLTALRDKYKKVPYHNWRHAVDVTQFVTYELITSGYDKILSSFELYGLLVACLCHDANHDGFTNVYNVKAETPLGILFKNQSVMETHHCAIAIDIISKEETNIFASLNPAEYKKMWSLIINLILITDMAKHFTFLKEFNGLFDAGEWKPKENPQHFLMLMQMLLKCGDISNVSRPFELADKWCDVLCEEFFRQGDLEQAQGMNYTSDLNDRAHLDKPKSQIGFYTFVCLPLYQATAKAIPKLQVNVDQVNSNLAIWKKAQEDKKKAEEEEEARKKAAAEENKSQEEEKK